MSNSENYVPDDYQFDEETSKKFLGLISGARDAGKKLGLPDNFLNDLMKELSSNDDWAFIIKAHALIESMINHMLAEKMHIKGTSFDWKKEEISDFFTRLPIGGKNGKGDFARKLGVIPDGLYDFLVRLSEIRNFYVHDLRNMDIKVEQYIFEKHKNRKHEFYKAFYPNYDDNKEFAHSYPEKAIKLMIMMGVLAYLSLMPAILRPPRTLLTGWLDEEKKVDNAVGS